MLPGSVLGMVPGGGVLSVLRWRLVRTRRQRSWCPFALRCAHKGPELGNVVRTQGRNQAVVCGVVLRSSVPCVCNRVLRAKGASSTIRCIEASGP